MSADTPATEAWMQAAGVEIARQVWHMTALDKSIEFTAIIARHHATRPVAPTVRPEQPAADKRLLDGPDERFAEQPAAPDSEFGPVTEKELGQPDKVPAWVSKPAAPDVAALAAKLAEDICPDINNPMDPGAARTRLCVRSILTPALSALVVERDAAVKDYEEALAERNKAWRRADEIEADNASRITRDQYREREVKNLTAALTTAREREARLVEALKFYADSGNYCRLFFPSMSPDDPRTFAPVLQDGGKCASAALLTPPPAGTEKTL